LLTFLNKFFDLENKVGYQGLFIHLTLLKIFEYFKILRPFRIVFKNGIFGNELCG